MKQVGFACQTGLKAGVKEQRGAVLIKEVPRKNKLAQALFGSKMTPPPDTKLGKAAYNKHKAGVLGLVLRENNLM